MTELMTCPVVEVPAQETAGILIATAHTHSGSTYAIVVLGEKVTVVRKGEAAYGFDRGAMTFDVEAIWMDVSIGEARLMWRLPGRGPGNTSWVVNLEVHHPIGHAFFGC